MIKLLGKIPRKAIVCCSGGPDSMAAVDFLKRSNREISLIYFDHGTAHGKEARAVVQKYAQENQIPLTIHDISGVSPSGESLEKWWRDKRYHILHRLDVPVITAHNLNDVAEWWIFTALRGNPRLTPYRNKNVIKPFLLTPKRELERWCIKNNTPYVIDPSNFGERFARSRIRQNIVPEAIKINPGLLTTMSKKIIQHYEENKNEN